MRAGKGDRILPHWEIPSTPSQKPREGVSFYHRGGALNERITNLTALYLLDRRPGDQTCRDSAQAAAQTADLSEFEMIVRAAKDLDDDGC
jgi:hypothetical protein